MFRPYIKRPQATMSDSWMVPQLCKAYDWPTGLAGGGVIAIIELGGGWSAEDIQQFASENDIPMPIVADIVIDGPGNHPGVDTDADGEVALDIEVAAASYSVATHKAAHIRVYWTSSIATGISAAAKDGCDVCSISWGTDETNWPFFEKNELKAAMLQANAAKMIVFAASGDNDSSDGGPTPANVDLPASCPSIIGCGGTSKTGRSEVVWNNDPGVPSGEGTGGGFSTFYEPLAVWQIGAPNGPGRMVPDISANADPDTGYQTVVAGRQEIVGGTSAVAPLYAGLFAALGRHLGPVSWTLWRNPMAFNDITHGDNGMYRAAQGPDPCTGLGSPIGSKLAAIFAKA